jgi:hypothetical protein
MGIPESVYKADSRFNTEEARIKNSVALVALFDEYFAKKTREEYIKSFEGKMKNPYLCEKCGKRLAITLPRHLRKRLDVCECDKK